MPKHGNESLHEVRAELTRIDAEREKVQGAAVPLDEALARLTEWRKRMGEGFERPFHQFSQRAFDPLFPLAPPGASGELLQLELTRLFCALFPKQVDAFIRTRIEGAIKAAPLSLSSEQREKRLAELAQQRLAVEIQEEQIIRRVLGTGVHVMRRRDARPEIVLAVSFGDDTARQNTAA